MASAPPPPDYKNDANALVAKLNGLREYCKRVIEDVRISDDDKSAFRAELLRIETNVPTRAFSSRIRGITDLTSFTTFKNEIEVEILTAEDLQRRVDENLVDNTADPGVEAIATEARTVAKKAMYLLSDKSTIQSNETRTLLASILTKLDSYTVFAAKHRGDIEESLVKAKALLEKVEGLGSSAGPAPAAPSASGTDDFIDGLDVDQKTKDFLYAVTDAKTSLITSMIRTLSAINSKVNEEVNLQQSTENSAKLNRYKDDLAKKKVTLERESESGTFKNPVNISRINKLEEEIRRLENTIDDLKRKSEIPVSSALLETDMDANVAFLKKYRMDLQAAVRGLKIDKEKSVRLSEILRERFATFSAELESHVIGKYVDVSSTLDGSALNSFSLGLRPAVVAHIKKMRDTLRDHSAEISLIFASVNSEIQRGVRKTADPAEVNKNSVATLYGLKVFRIITCVIALYVSEKIFIELYNKQISGTAKQVVDLRWFALIYCGFQLAFDCILLAVLYFARRVDPKAISSALFFDFAIDTLIVYLMVTATTVWLSDVVQDRRYFAYRTSAPRAVRSLRSMVQWAAILHGATPYFFSAGPFMLGKNSTGPTKESLKKENPKKETPKESSPP